MSVLTDREILSVLNRELVIHPYEERCLSPLGYDLRIGYAINLSTQATTTADPRPGTLVIPAGTSTFVIAKEHVWLSRHLVGTLHARGSLAAKGLFINSTTIDPNWSGQMTFLLYNASDHPVELGVEATFATMVLFRAALPTENAPPTNPINVAETHGNFYGEVFSRSLMAYITNQENRSIEREFHALIHKATTPSATEAVMRSLYGFFGSFRQDGATHFTNAVTLLVWVLAFAGLFVGFTIQWFWPTLQRMFGFTEPYGPSIMMGQAALVVAALSVFTRLLKKG